MINGLVASRQQKQVKTTTLTTCTCNFFPIIPKITIFWILSVLQRHAVSIWICQITPHYQCGNFGVKIAYFIRKCKNVKYKSEKMWKIDYCSFKKWTLDHIRSLMYLFLFQQNQPAVTCTLLFFHSDKIIQEFQVTCLHDVWSNLTAVYLPTHIIRTAMRSEKVMNTSHVHLPLQLPFSTNPLSNISLAVV